VPVCCLLDQHLIPDGSHLCVQTPRLRREVNSVVMTSQNSPCNICMNYRQVYFRPAVPVGAGAELQVLQASSPASIGI
jgi:hypothetical protein